MITCVDVEFDIKDANKEMKYMRFDAKSSVKTWGKAP